MAYLHPQNMLLLRLPTVVASVFTADDGTITTVYKNANPLHVKQEFVVFIPIAVNKILKDPSYVHQLNLTGYLILFQKIALTH
jgi:hypothetical protein